MMNSAKLLSVGSVIAFVVMVAVNALANILPINGITTGAVSDAYPNLFAPAGVTFSIWGVIYLLLGIYSVYQLVQVFGPGSPPVWLTRINSYFLTSSLINILWIFAWHYQLIWLTVVLMLGLLMLLIKIADTIRREELLQRQKLLIKVPFGVYFGWITIATIANITTFLVSIGWNGSRAPSTYWTISVLLVGSAISIGRMLKDSNIAYGLVPIWAYAGIMLKHTSSSGFNNAYPTIIVTTLVCLGVLALSNGYLLYSKRAL
jgi:hypothetical protein